MPCECEKAAAELAEKKVLVSVAWINAVMFIIEVFFGWISESTALLADSLDMLADATVYGIAIYAVGKPAIFKIRAARVSGVTESLLGFMVLFDVLRRFYTGSEPDSTLMMLIGFVALCANIACMQLISRFRDGEIHMRASWIFSRNDVIANLGIILGGLSVSLTGMAWPDLLIGLLISTVVIRGGISILRDAKRETQALVSEN